MPRDDALCAMERFRAALSAARKNEAKPLCSANTMAIPVACYVRGGEDIYTAMFDSVEAFNSDCVHNLCDFYGQGVTKRTVFVP